MKKYVLLCLSILFLLFAILQFNDPDPAFWIIVYVSVAISLLAGFLGRAKKKYTLILMIAIILTSLFYIAGFFEWLTMPSKKELFGQMNYEKPYIEETREFLGLLIATLALYYQFKTSAE